MITPQLVASPSADVSAPNHPTVPACSTGPDRWFDHKRTSALHCDSASRAPVVEGVPGRRCRAARNSTCGPAFLSTTTSDRYQLFWKPSQYRGHAMGASVPPKILQRRNPSGQMAEVSQTGIERRRDCFAPRRPVKGAMPRRRSRSDPRGHCELMTRLCRYTLDTLRQQGCRLKRSGSEIR